MTAEHDVRFWRGAAAVLAVAVLALVVAAAIGRSAPDFANRKVLAVLRDDRERPVWQIRLARSAHEIAVRALQAEPAPKDRAFELWLVAAKTAMPIPLGILPPAGQKVIPLAPRAAALLTGSGALLVTLEPSEGAPDLRPGGAPMFQGRLRNVINSAEYSPSRSSQRVDPEGSAVHTAARA
jgi:anti-sigma-K factor RskA